MFVARSARDSVADNCAGQHAAVCNLEEAGSSRVRTWETISWTSGALAVAAVATGLVIDLSRPAKPRSAYLRPSGVAVVGLIFEGRF